MRFLAKYAHRSVKPYYRTIFADDQTEANRTALRYCKKDYTLRECTHQPLED